MKRAAVIALSVISILLVSASGWAMGQMGNMPMPAAPAQPPAKPDSETVNKLFATALDGLGFSEEQAMKVHEAIAAMLGPMDELMVQIDQASGSEKELKMQEMMLLMEKVQVEVDAAVNETQALVLDALVFGVFPDAKSHPADKTLAARLKAAESLRAALDDHAIARKVLERLAALMPGMPGMSMTH